jgi:transposase-like protein
MANVGRHTKLTAETQAAVVKAIEGGYTLGSAARMAGIGRWTLFKWIRDISHFSHAVRAAQKQAAETKIKANPRPLARARYEHDATPDEMRNAFYREIVRCREQGRVPYDVALDALQMAVDELQDIMDNESVSWAGDPATAPTTAPAHGVHRGRA